MGSRDFDNDAPRHRHGSHRKPHGADGKRTDDPYEEPISSRHGATRDVDDDLTNDSGGMGDFLESLKGMNIDSRHDSTGGRFDDRKNDVWHEGGLHPREEYRDKRRRQKEHRHGEHGHKEPGHGEHRHGERGHEEHRHADQRREEGELKRFKQKLYETALLPFHEKSGSSYPCKQAEIDFHYYGVFAKPNKGPFLSAMQATQEVMRWNDEKRAPPWEELDIIRRLTIAVHDAEKNLRFRPDLLIKTFADLDRVFFGGQLRGHVVVRWVDTIDSGRKHGTVLGHTKFSGVEPGQTRIEMNAEAILLQKWSNKAAKNSVATMFGVLLHEMCHAYQGVRCPYERDKGDGHGEHFQTMIGVIHDRAIRILGTDVIFDWQTYKQHHFLPKEGEKGGKGGLGVRSDDGKKCGGSERKRTGTSTGVERQGWGSHKGTDCVVM